MRESKKGRLKFPIGVQAFENIVSGNYLYVDKTKYVYELVNNYSYVFLSRPRRFGKSLFTSTLKCYLEGKKDLFEGLEIMGLEEEWNKYIVLHFDFSRAKSFNIKEFNEDIDKQLFMYEKVYERGEKDLDVGQRLEGLVTRAYEKTGRKVCIIVDEYDAPVLSVLQSQKELENVRQLIRKFYSPIKSLDPYLKFVFLTGITKFSQLSIFSELNNLKDISMLPQYSAICGISKEEIKEGLMPYVREMAISMGVTDEKMFYSLAEYYDGYHFCKNGSDIYNPFSLMNAFSDKELQPYWFSSGTPTFLVNYIKEHSIDETELSCMKAVPIGDFNVSPEVSESSLPLLYQSGYLTIKGYDSMFGGYTLGYPNKEVKVGFEECLLNYYNGKELSGSSFVLDFTKALYENKIEDALCLMKIFFSSIPYDLFNKKEKHFQTIFYLIFSLLGQYIQSEVKMVTGRADAVVKTKDCIYVFEMKVDQTAKIALQQIEDKGYLIPYLNKGKRLIKVGLNFSTEERTLKDWIIKSE